MLVEFPFSFGFSLQWALIKSYAIANGTQLLVRTRRLTDEKIVGKRGEDTGIILYEVLFSGIDTERGRRALAKMNWIHARYGEAITNGDLIHTLALFVLEPFRFINRFEWRKLKRIEEVALFQYWKEVGYRMGMTNIPETLDDLVVWTKEYEDKNMKYSLNNAKCYSATVNLFLRHLPPWTQTTAKKLADSMLEDYVQPHLGVQRPPNWAYRIVNGFFISRAFFVRYFMLPRFRPMIVVLEGPEGRLQRKKFAFEPWYVPETIWTRLQRRLGLGGKYVPGPEYKSEGYYPEELGPKEFEKSSKDAVLLQASQLKEYSERGGAEGMGCPFAFARGT
ncbi:hypothetical protein M433DRAFT_146255 [Acidomyces richmondensis BFW]|nr:MAG: hypothetical protein FE78DRAFT_81581 [Acidomyces sp. 'richmondensis']KYG43016.1 hypothetical protein M433DRAFT_146255 [Acidomyces richmondensis BFW]